MLRVMLERDRGRDRGADMCRCGVAHSVRREIIVGVETGC